MDESNLEPEQTLARSFVDQVRPGAHELGERGGKVAHVERDVMHARATLREEPADGSVGAKGLEQLDATVPDAQRHRTYTLLLDRRAVLDLGAEETLVRRECRFEVVDRDTKMVDPARLHAGEATERAW